MNERNRGRFLDAGSTPMHYAVVEGDLKKLTSLLKTSRHLLNVRDKNGRTPYVVAVLMRNTDAWKLLLDAQADSKAPEEDCGKESILEKVAWFAFKTTAASLAIIGGTALALPAIGFGAAGVTAGSLAASYQSAVLGGYIAKGSLFALLQSTGAAGLAASTKAAVVAGTAFVVGVHEKMADPAKKKEKKKSS